MVFSRFCVNSVLHLGLWCWMVAGWCPSDLLFLEVRLSAPVGAGRAQRAHLAVGRRRQACRRLSQADPPLKPNRRTGNAVTWRLGGWFKTTSETQLLHRALSRCYVCRVRH